MHKTKKNTEVIIFILVLVVLTGYVYWNYITLNKLYIFKDVGVDSFFAFYPALTHFADYVRDEGIPMWSFNYGLGQNIFNAIPDSLGDPFNIILAILGRSAIPYALGYIQFIKVIISGLVFFYFLKQIGIKNYSASLIAFFYSFTGHILIRGGWYHYSNDGILFAMLLLSYEMYYRKNKPYLLPITLFLIVSSRGIYYVYLYTLILFGYSSVRYLIDREFELHDFARHLLKLTKIYLVGLVLSGVFLLPGIYGYLDSPRVTGNYSYFTKLICSKVLSFATPQEYFTSFMSILSPTILGVGDKFTGYRNILEAPQYYCGLLTLLLVPQLLVNINGKKKLACAILISLCLVYSIFPYARFIVNGFSGYYYKISSFWISVVLLIMAAFTLELIMQKKRINNTVLIITITILAGPVTIFLLSDKFYALGSIYKEPALMVIGFLVLYTIALALLNYKKSMAQFMIAILVIGEILAFAPQAVNDRVTLVTEDLSSRNYYKDYTNEAIAYLNSIDRDFYRVGKTYYSVYLNDSQMQKYKGTKVYRSMSGASTIEFANALDIPFMDKSCNCVFGFHDRYKLDTLVGVKYLLSKDDKVPFGYEPISSFEDIFVYRNQYYLPLGYTYDNYIRTGDFTKLENNLKDKALLRAFVIDNEASIPVGYTKLDAGMLNNDWTTIDMKKLGEIKTYNSSIVKNNFPTEFIFSNTTNDPMIILPLTIKGEQRLSLTLEIDSDVNTLGQVFWKTNTTDYNEQDSYRFSIVEGQKTYQIDLDIKDMLELRLDIGNHSEPEEYSIKNVKAKYGNTDAQNNEYIQAVDSLKKEAMHITDYSQNRITGEIQVSSNKFLFLSIPYDKGWSIKLNGMPAKLEKVSIGFMGVFLPKGNYDIELKYRTPYLISGIILSIVGVLFYTTLVIQYLRHRKV